MLLPSPLCSQVILGMGANAATVPNNTARAVSSPPMGAYILIDTGFSGGFSSKCCGQRPQWVFEWTLLRAPGP